MGEAPDMLNGFDGLDDPDVLKDVTARVLGNIVDKVMLDAGMFAAGVVVESEALADVEGVFIEVEELDGVREETTREETVVGEVGETPLGKVVAEVAIEDGAEVLPDWVSPGIVPMVLVELVMTEPAIVETMVIELDVEGAAELIVE